MAKKTKRSAQKRVPGLVSGKPRTDKKFLRIALVAILVGGFGLWKLVESFAALPPLIHVHDSGRYDKPVRLLLADAKYQRGFASIITRTELSNTERFQTLAEATRADNWSIRRVGGAGPYESSVEWDNSVWKLVGEPASKQLTSLTYYREDGTVTPPFTVTRVRLSHVGVPSKIVAVFVVHMPVRNTERRREVWASALTGLTNIIKSNRQNLPADQVLITGDWNMNWRDASERATLLKFRDTLNLYTTWGGGRMPDSGGTHGSEIIDMSFTTMPINAARLLPDTEASDHRAFREDLRL